MLVGGSRRSSRRSPTATTAEPRRSSSSATGAAVRVPARAAGPVRAGLVVCPPILADFGANYQREVRLGRQLAAAGIVVQRFHPRGAGQSDGDGVDLTLDSMIEDALAAVAQLRERSPGRHGRCHGHPLRRARRRAPSPPSSTARRVVLWEPTTDPRRFFREGLRARAVHQFKAGTAAPPEPEDPEAELARCGFIDLLGAPVGGPLFHTPGDRDLATLMGERPRPVLLRPARPAGRAAGRVRAASSTDGPRWGSR